MCYGGAAHTANDCSAELQLQADQTAYPPETLGATRKRICSHLSGAEISTMGSLPSVGGGSMLSITWARMRQGGVVRASREGWRGHLCGVSVTPSAGAKQQEAVLLVGVGAVLRQHPQQRFARHPCDVAPRLHRRIPPPHHLGKSDSSPHFMSTYHAHDPCQLLLQTSTQQLPLKSWASVWSLLTEYRASPSSDQQLLVPRTFTHVRGA